MDRAYVTSTNIASVGYDERTQTLEVEFNGGGIYQYYNVPQSIYDDIMKASSVGQFFNVHVKNSYPYSRVG